MILSGKEIVKHLGKEIIIEPFHPERVNPNSYNLSLHNELMVYDHQELDMPSPIRHRLFISPSRATSCSLTSSIWAGPMNIPGLTAISHARRPVVRRPPGVFIHVTAGFGDVGFAGYWTLEIFCVQPIRIYPNVEICQIYYHDIDGEYDTYQHGKYQNNTGIQPVCSGKTLKR